MAKLLDQIQVDMKAAMKARSQVELGTLRLLKSDIQYEMTRDGSDDLADDKVEAIIRRNIKKRKDSIDQYKKAGRDESAASEQAELEILEKYLPPAVGDDEIQKVIDEVFAKVNPTGPGDMGKLMGPVMGRFKGQNIDGSRVKELVQARIAGIG
ncbi:MAG: GatB/YqeY domain-containing protein [bacterium]|nr:GatB/YqeY domain-containing protein [bacterium]